MKKVLQIPDDISPLELLRIMKQIGLSADWLLEYNGMEIKGKTTLSMLPIEWVKEIQESNEVCIWKVHPFDDQQYETECGRFHYVPEGGLSGSDYIFCSYCGKPIGKNN